MANPSLLVRIVNQESGVSEGMPGTVALTIAYALSDQVFLPDGVTPVQGVNPSGTLTGNAFLDSQTEACINATLTDAELQSAAINAAIAHANGVVSGQGGATVFTAADVRMP